MKNSNIIKMDNINRLIIEDRIEGAISSILKNTQNDEISRELISLTARLKRIQSDSIKGIISFEQYNLIKNQIINSLIILSTNKADTSSIAIDKKDPSESIEGNTIKLNNNILEGSDIIIGGIKKTTK